MTGAERIAKRIARAGLCSRREAEAWIAAGRVSVDGEVLHSPAVTVTPDQQVSVDGVTLPEAPATRLFRYHKPAGLLVSTRDPSGRPTIFDRLPPNLPRLQAIGRLDLTTEGLLLLTNDGELKRRLELPATGWLRRYRARAYGAVTQEALDTLRQGIEIEGLRYGPIEAQLERRTGANCWITLALAEGKNREVRKVLEHLGLKVNRLLRISYGPFHLGRLGRGEIAEVPAKVLREQLGLGKPREQKIGTAKAKPRPRKPAQKARAAARKAHAYRRRPA